MEHQQSTQSSNGIILWIQSSNRLKQRIAQKSFFYFFIYLDTLIIFVYFPNTAIETARVKLIHRKKNNILKKPITERFSHDGLHCKHAPGFFLSLQRKIFFQLHHVHLLKVFPKVICRDITCQLLCKNRLHCRQ